MPTLHALRRSSRLAWLLLVALLFQQFAVAAHACVDAAVGSQVAEQASSTHHGAVEPPCHDPLPAFDSSAAHAADALCVEHCAPAQVTPTDLATGQVPPSSLPLPTFEWPAVAGSTRLASSQAFVGAVDPPPILRFCQLLI